jgi:hypothetical protein
MTAKEAYYKKFAELTEHYTQEGCIQVEELHNGTRVLLRTASTIYEIEVGTASRRVVLLASEEDCWQSRDKATVIGSIDPKTKIMLKGMICKDAKLTLRPRDQTCMQIGPILSAKIIGKNNEYSYELWAS